MITHTRPIVNYGEKLYKTYIFNNDSLDQVLEDQSLYWNDDKEIVDTFVLKTIKRFDEKKGANQELLPEFKDDEDQEFARRLFRRTILNSDYYRHLLVRIQKIGIWTVLHLWMLSLCRLH